MIDEKNFITAYFIDNERKNIEILLRNDDGASVYTHILEYDPEHPDCKELLEICNLDNLHENTWEKKRGEKEDFEKMAISIAKKSGLVFDEHKLDTKFYPVLVKAIFDEEENEDHLFALKLALFEVEKIRNSKNTKLKTKLRKAKSKIEVLRFAFDIVG